MSAKNKVRYDMELVKLVRYHRCIYDKSMSVAITMPMINDAWQNIGYILQRLGIPIEDPIKRWSQLRTTFIRHYSKGNTNWYLYGAMQFLVGHFKSRSICYSGKNAGSLQNPSEGMDHSSPHSEESSDFVLNSMQIGISEDRVQYETSDDSLSRASTSTHGSSSNTRSMFNFMQLPSSILTQRSNFQHETSSNLNDFLSRPSDSTSEDISVNSFTRRTEPSKFTKNSFQQKTSKSSNICLSEEASDSASEIRKWNESDLAEKAFDCIKYELLTSEDEVITVEDNDNAPASDSLQTSPQSRQNPQSTIAAVVHNFFEEHSEEKTLTDRESTNHTETLKVPEGVKFDLDWTHITDDFSGTSSSVYSARQSSSEPILKQPILAEQPKTKNDSTKVVNPFTACAVNKKQLQTSTILNTSSSKKTIIVPPFDKFAMEKKKKQKNLDQSDVVQAITRSADDFHKITEHCTTLMKLKTQVLQNRINQPPVQPQMPVVQGDALFNLLRHHWLQLTLNKQEELFPLALVVMERFQSNE